MVGGLSGPSWDQYGGGGGTNDTEDIEQDQDALNETSGDGEIPSGVVDSESGEYTDGADPDNSSGSDTSSDDGPPAMAGVVFVAVLLAWFVYGGD